MHKYFPHYNIPLMCINISVSVFHFQSFQASSFLVVTHKQLLASVTQLCCCRADFCMLLLLLLAITVVVLRVSPGMWHRLVRRLLHATALCAILVFLFIFITLVMHFSSSCFYFHLCDDCCSCDGVLFSHHCCLALLCLLFF